jgi:putative sterol carrier protein
VVTRDSLIVALRTTFRPEFARGTRVNYELHVGEIVLHACVDDGALQAGQGPVPNPDLVIDTQQGLKGLLTGELAPSEAVLSGILRITGDRALLDRFVEMFHMPTGRG